MEKYSLFNVALYIRLSREDGDKAESDSIVNQRKLLADYLKGRDDFVVYDTYIDDGFSGTNFRRPAFQRMIADIEAGEVNCVVVKDLSRFGRDYIDTGKYLERYFPEKNVRFISLTDNIDSDKQAYDMLLPIKNIFNEQYARDISRKIHASIQTKQKAGEFIGAFAAYGYQKSPADKNKLIIDEYAADVVRKIFSLYIRGCGKYSIAHMLNKEGIACPSEYKALNGANYKNHNRLESTKYWTYSTINQLLRNEVYIGNMVQGRKSQRMRSRQKAKPREDWTVVAGTHEAIIDRETWEKTQNLLKRRTRELDLNTNMGIYAGFVKCGDCGRALVKKVGSPGHGEGIINYYCGTYVRSGRRYCTPHPMPFKTLEAIVLEDLRVIIQSIDNLKEIIAKQGAERVTVKCVNVNERARLRAELEKIQKLKKAVYEDYREELISKEEFVSYRQDYIRKEELLLKQLSGLETKPEQTARDIFELPWVKRLVELRTIESLDRDIVVEMIHEIKVYENRKIKITYNFSDELADVFKSSIQQGNYRN